jgi:hypothetical protein
LGVGDPIVDPYAKAFDDATFQANNFYRGPAAGPLVDDLKATVSPTLYVNPDLFFRGFWFDVKSVGDFVKVIRRRNDQLAFC